MPLSIDEKTITMQITANFDSGNIRVIKAESADDIQLEIKHDNQSSNLTTSNSTKCQTKYANFTLPYFPLN